MVANRNPRSSLNPRNSFADILQVIRTQLALCQKEKRIQKYEETQGRLGEHHFAVTLAPEEVFTFRTVSEKGFKGNPFLKSNSTKTDQITVDDPNWVKATSVCDFLEQRIYDRRQWLLLKTGAYLCLKEFLVSDQNNYLDAIEINFKGADLACGYLANEKLVMTPFNIRPSKRWVIKNHEKSFTTPSMVSSIYFELKDLELNPQQLVGKVRTLVHFSQEKNSAKKSSKKTFHIL